MVFSDFLNLKYKVTHTFTNTTNILFYNNFMPKKYITRSFHSSRSFFIYPDVDSEYDAVNTKELGKDTSKDKSSVIDEEVAENKHQANLVREDLRNHLKKLDNITKARISNARIRRESFDNHINGQDQEIKKLHDDAYSTSNVNNPKYEDKINESGIRKAMFSVYKSERSAHILGTNVSEEEKETVNAIKGLTKDIFQLRENRFELINLKKHHDIQPDKFKDTKGSLLDDYADVSAEMPDYTGGED